MSDVSQPLGIRPPYTPPKGSGLATTGFVLSCIFFIPFLPLIGAILGVIALATMGSRRGKGLAIAAICVGLGVTLVVQAMLAAIAIPSFMRYIRRSKSMEAKMELRSLSYGARDAWQESSQFPVATTDWTPAAGCCEFPQGKCAPVVSDWQKSPWVELGFTVDAPHYYQYRYRSDGQRVMIEARGDLDCDGSYSLFAITGTAEGGSPEFGIVSTEDELE